MSGVGTGLLLTAYRRPARRVIIEMHIMSEAADTPHHKRVSPASGRLLFLHL